MSHLISVEIDSDVAERLVQVLGHQLEVMGTDQYYFDLNNLHTALADALENDDA